MDCNSKCDWKSNNQDTDKDTKESNDQEPVVQVSFIGPFMAPKYHDSNHWRHRVTTENVQFKWWFRTYTIVGNVVSKQRYNQIKYDRSLELDGSFVVLDKCQETKEYDWNYDEEYVEEY